MNVEVTYSATIDNQTMLIRVAEQMETKNEAKIREMKDVIAEFVSSGPQGRIEVRCTPAITSDAQNQTSSSSKQGSTTSNGDDTITLRQIGIIKKTLREQNRTENDFCKHYHVNSVEDLSKSNAQWIIKELIANIQR